MLERYSNSTIEVKAYLLCLHSQVLNYGYMQLLQILQLFVNNSLPQC